MPTDLPGRLDVEFGSYAFLLCDFAEPSTKLPTTHPARSHHTNSRRIGTQCPSLIKMQCVVAPSGGSYLLGGCTPPFVGNMEGPQQLPPLALGHDGELKPLGELMVMGELDLERNHDQ